MERAVCRKASCIPSASPSPACTCCLLPRDPAACFSLQLERVFFHIRIWCLMRSLKKRVLHSKLAAQLFPVQQQYFCSVYMAFAHH